MTFEKLYDNPLLVTALPCVVAAVVLAVAQRRAAFARVFGSVFAVEIAADAWLNGAWSPVKQGTALATGVSITFVILGDFRYFVVLEEASDHAYKLVRAVVLAFLVPVSTQIVRGAMPRLVSDDRSTFLLYEVFFFALAAGIRLFHVGRVRRPRLALRATQFELVQYGTWIAADIGIIVTSADAFHGLRIVANLLYYVAFLPVMLWLLSDEKR
jgi:hypothetical protein